MADSEDGVVYDLGDRGDDRPGLEDVDPDLVEDDDDDEDDDDVEDALEDDVDFIMAMYREDGTPVVTALDIDLANDLDDLIAHLQRLPGDSRGFGPGLDRGGVLRGGTCTGPSRARRAQRHLRG